MAAHRASDSQLYLSVVPIVELDQAQAELDEHLPSGADGRCLACRQEIPCRTRERASLTFQRYGALPQRRPGLARVRPVGNVGLAMSGPVAACAPDSQGA